MGLMEKEGERYGGVSSGQEKQIKSLFTKHHPVTHSHTVFKYKICVVLHREKAQQLG